MALWMGNAQWGVINALLQDFGLIDEYIPWFASLDLTMLAVILTNSWKFAIFVTIMVLARLQSIPEGYYEAARMSGATTYQQFRDITLPNLKNVILIVLLLRGVWMFNKFDIIWVLTNGGPGDRTTTAPIFAYMRAFLDYSLGEAAAISTVLFSFLAVVAAIYFWYFEPHKEVRVQ
jgi:multiple sugar transport system permease protein